MIPASERQEFLRTIPIFAGLNEAALSELVTVAEEVSVESNEVIVSEGEAGNRMFIIYSGRVEVVKYLGQPKETILADVRTPRFSWRNVDDRMREALGLASRGGTDLPFRAERHRFVPALPPPTGSIRDRHLKHRPRPITPAALDRRKIRGGIPLGYRF